MTTTNVPDQWFCDTCGDLITDPNMSIVTWREDEQRRAYDFRVVHKSTNGVGCDPGKAKGFTSYTGVAECLGVDGAAHLLSRLSLGPLKPERGFVQVADFDQFVDLFRRMQTPHYEEARRHFKCPDVRSDYADANEVMPYLPDHLARIATLCADCAFTD